MPTSRTYLTSSPPAGRSSGSRSCYPTLGQRRGLPFRPTLRRPTRLPERLAPHRSSKNQGDLAAFTPTPQPAPASVALAPQLRPHEDGWGAAVRARELPRPGHSRGLLRRAAAGRRGSRPPGAGAAAYAICRARRCRRALRSRRSSRSSLTHRRSVPRSAAAVSPGHAIVCRWRSELPWRLSSQPLFPRPHTHSDRQMPF